MFKRKMKQEQIEAALDEIRSRYDRLTSDYGKPAALKDSFNERYYDALRMRMGLDNFFKNEISAVEALENGIQNEKKKSAALKESVEKKSQQKQSTAQKVWEENLQRIEKYPEYHFHDDAAHDIVKLLGAMKRYEEKNWPDLMTLFRATGTGRQMEVRTSLELKWREFTSPSAGKLPSRIVKYSNLLSCYPKDPKEIEWEERQILYDAARFLGSISEFIREFMLNDRLEVNVLSSLKNNKEELDSILEDFRLQDLSRLSGRKYI